MVLEVKGVVTWGGGGGGVGAVRIGGEMFWGASNVWAVDTQKFILQ